MALNHLVLNQLDDAKDYIMQAIQEESNHEYVQFCAGRILYARGEYEEAKPYLIRAIEQNPDIETQNTLALTYFALENYKQALNIFKNIDTIIIKTNLRFPNTKMYLDKNLTIK